MIHEILVGKEVHVRTADRSLVLYKEDKAWRIDTRKQIDGLVAHLVHSLDAAHMMSRSIVFMPWASVTLPWFTIATAFMPAMSICSIAFSGKNSSASTPNRFCRTF